jgi:hypothetical protein
MALIGWISMSQGVHDEVERMLDECVAACVPDPQARANWRTDPSAISACPDPWNSLWAATTVSGAGGSMGFDPYTGNQPAGIVA